MCYKQDYSDSRVCELALKNYLESKYDDVERASETEALNWDLRVPSQDLIIEAKVDRIAGVSSPNVAVEIACRNKPSGLTITAANWWCFFIQGRCYAVPVEKLRALTIDRKHVMGGDDKAAELVLVPIAELKRIAYVYPPFEAVAA